ncbi:hypothetical protein AgCh_002175 [Apium graveolens]
MSGKGVHGGKAQRFHRRACLGGKSLKSWNRKGRRSNYVVIDVDCDNYDDPGIFRGSGSNGKRKDRNCSYAATVICIDDDDEEGCEETKGDDSSGTGWYFRGNRTLFKLSKCKRTYSGKASTSYCGLGTHSKIVLSDDDDGFDVEFGGSSGKIKQDWEKAFLRKRNECFSTVDQAGTSRVCSDSPQDKGTGDKTEKGGVGLDFTKYRSHEEVDRSSSVAMDEGKLEEGREASAFDWLNSVFNDQPLMSDGTSRVCSDSPQDIGTRDKTEKCGGGLDFTKYKSHEEVHRSSSIAMDEGKAGEGLEASTFDWVNSVFNDQPLTSDGTSRVCSGSPQDIGTGDKAEKCGGGGLDFTNYTSQEEVDRSPSITMDEDKSEKGCEASTFDWVNSVTNDQPFTSALAGPSINCIDNQLTGKEMKSNKDSLQVAIVNGQCSGDTNNDSVLFNREMHKETDEYRCSVEAELAARQRELEIQAEEARHLKRMRKREKAEAMRLLDMERRQKMRLEEMRETQKKDEENLHLKEQLRVEVRKGLSRLEAACYDMTSILRGLGINVNGVNGVHAAFKRALLSFHPDRSSQSDIRQQVEAEEKFKLVTRMKEKYLSTL